MASYPRRQHHRRLRRAAAGAAGTVVAVAVAVLAAGIGAVKPAAILLVAALGLVLYTRGWLRLARCSAVGARSEKRVQRALEPLRAEGWRLRHGLSWRGRGDIDHVAIAPTGVAFAIETKTRSYDERHLTTVRDQAQWLGRRRRRWSPNGALPVLCVTRGRIERLHGDVLVVSVDHLAAALRARASTSPRPGFLAPASADAPLSGAAARRRGWLPPQRRCDEVASPIQSYTRELALTPGVRSVSKPLRFRRESWTCLPRLT